MNETTFYFSKKKQVRITLLFLILFNTSLLWITYLFSKNSFFLSPHGLFVIIITLFTGGGTVKLLSKLLSSNKQAALILNKQGILSNVTSNSKKIGLIYWREIQNISRTKVTNTNYVCIKLNKLDCITNEVYISASELNASFEEIESTIINYYNSYKSKE